MKASLALLLIAIGVSSYAQLPGTFTPTGSMTTARDEHTATLLTNGKVLIAGGYKSSTPDSTTITLASAELYDPSTGAFSATGALTTARLLHSATLLSDGRVLIAGGYSSFPSKQPLVSAELYDPAIGTFTATGNMLTAGPGTATLLANGWVLIAHDPLLSSNPIAAELYDPVTGTFSATGNQQMNPNDTSQTAALLPDGRVILVACCNQVQLYDPASGAFSLKNVPGLLQNFEQNFDFTMSLLANGKLLLSGGCFCEGNAGDPVSAHAAVYDPSTGTAAPTGNMTTARTLHSSTSLPDGTVLIAGGLRSTSSRDLNSTSELYDPVTATFSRSGDMITGRYGQTATLLLDGRVLIAGGLGGDGAAFGYLDRAEIYNPPPVTVVGGVFNSASYFGGAIAPGELVIVTGYGLGPDQIVVGAPGGDGLYGSQLAGTSVLINGTPAPLIYTWATQVAVKVPDSISLGTAQVAVTYQGQTSVSFPVRVVPSVPGIFTANSTGRGHAATVNQDGSIDTPSNGAVVTLFATGIGNTAPAVVVFYPDSVFQMTVPLSAQDVQANPSGVVQFKVSLPFGADCEVPIVVQVGGASSQAGVSIPVSLCI